MVLRNYREDTNLTQEQLITLLHGCIATVSKTKKITINERRLHKFFPAHYSKTEMERIIFGLLQQWKEAQGEDENE